MTGLVGVELSLGQIDHMVRYAAVSASVAGRRVLDIACGSGYGSQFLAQRGAASVVGVDIDQSAIQYAQTFHAHPHVRYLHGDAHGVPELDEASFDVIVAFETIEHVQRPRDFLLELRRLLRPGGQCFISCPNDHKPSPWISEFHVTRFTFGEFRDLVLTIFGEASFLGQHNMCSSGLLKPRPVSERCVSFGPYVEPLPPGFFGHQYLDSMAPIESAYGYFAVIGVDAALLSNHVSVSENAFQQMLTSMHFYSEEAKRARSEGSALGSEVADLRQRIETEMALRAQHDAARASETQELEERIRRAERRHQEVEARHADTISVLQRELTAQRAQTAEQETAHRDVVAALQSELHAQRTSAAEQEAAHRGVLAALHAELTEQRRVAAERAAAHRTHAAALQAQLGAHQRGGQDVAYRQSLTALREQLAAQQRGHAEVMAAYKEREVRLVAERDSIQLDLVAARDRATHLESERDRLRDTLRRSTLWIMRSAWLRLKKWATNQRIP